MAMKICTTNVFKHIVYDEQLITKIFSHQPTSLFLSFVIKKGFNLLVVVSDQKQLFETLKNMFRKTVKLYKDMFSENYSKREMID